MLPPLHIDIAAFDLSKLVLPPKLIICINMIHISDYRCTEALFEMASAVLTDGVLLTYGPYSVGGHMVDSNKAFDDSLRARNSEWGIRKLEDVEQTANSHGLYLEKTISMPANNLCCVFGKRTKVIPSV